jgi:hypothetical protein
MKNSISLHCEISLNENKWAWKIFHRRGSGNASISGLLPFPQQISPSEALFSIQQGKLLNRTDYAHFGAALYRKIIPTEFTTLLKQATGGDCLFVVPPEWATVPFELLYDNDGFWGDRFTIGTVILLPDTNIEHTQKNNSPLSFGIIADPANDLPEAYEEGVSIRNFLRSYKQNVRMTSSGSPEKIQELLSGNSVVHFAGHSEFSESTDKFGWKLKNGELFELSGNTKNSRINPPSLVFSNSCEAACTSKELAGVAGALMQSGVAQIVGPFTRVADKEAQQCATVFYEKFLQSMHPAQALLLMKKVYSNSAASLVYRLFGDPCWTFSQPTLSDVEPKHIEPIKRRNTKPVLLIAAIIIVILLILLFIPFPSGDGIQYIHPK